MRVTPVGHKYFELFLKHKNECNGNFEIFSKPFICGIHAYGCIKECGYRIAVLGNI